MLCATFPTAPLFGLTVTASKRDIAAIKKYCNLHPLSFPPLDKICVGFDQADLFLLFQVEFEFVFLHTKLKITKRNGLSKFGL